MDEDEPLGSSPEVISVSDEQEKEEKPTVKEYPPKSKDLKVTIETLTLRPVIPVDVNKRPQTARRGRGFHPDAPKPRWLGKTPTYNELEVAQTLVGLKQDQPKQGSIRNLRNKDIQEEKEEQNSDVKGVGERKLPSQGSCGSSVKEEFETKDTDLTEETVPREVKVNTGKLKLKKSKKIIVKQPEKKEEITELKSDKAGNEKYLKDNEQEKTVDKTEQVSNEKELQDNQKEDEATKVKKEIQKLSYEQEDADIRSRIETLKSILKLLEKPSDIRKKTDKQSDTDTSLTKTSLTKAEGESEENVVKYNVTIKVDSETEDEIKSSVTEVVEEIVRKIDEENSDNYKSEPLHKGSVELTDNLYMEYTGKTISDASSNAGTSISLENGSIKAERGVTATPPYPVHGYKSADVNVEAELPVVHSGQSGQPPGLSETETEDSVIETECAKVYINVSENETASSVKHVKFVDEIYTEEEQCDIFKACDTISFSSEEGALVIHEKSDFDELSVPTVAGYVVSGPPRSCLGGEVPLEDQDAFSCTPYKKKSAAEQVDGR